jgi:hypothetical protein
MSSVFFFKKIKILVLGSQQFLFKRVLHFSNNPSKSIIAKIWDNHFFCQLIPHMSIKNPRLPLSIWMSCFGILIKKIIFPLNTNTFRFASQWLYFYNWIYNSILRQERWSHESWCITYLYNKVFTHHLSHF